ncbi:zinc finger protein 503-like [Denticeps clupeoides]|uniref:C2H2-type domain-containing protein n=1 Tax=Denticeps clupeoides TaxID=299321 RepID=A0AAY4A9E7_9TELE|nr:zinc finger protein 503-like [Denticeps clupeoides]
MITSPPASAPNNLSDSPAWETNSGQRLAHLASPADPVRQANRLPIRAVKMLTARAGHLLHPEYLQPLPSTPISPIELDAKKSPLALLAQTCSQIGKPDPPSSSKLASATSGGSGDKDPKCGPLKISDIGAEDKSSFKPYAKSADKKEPSSAASAGDKACFRVPSATCRPFTPRTGSPNSCASASPLPSDCKPAEREDKKEGGAPERTSGGDSNPHQEAASKAPPASDASPAGLGSGLVAPVSPYRPGHTVFPLPPTGIPYPGSLAGAYAGYPQPFLPPGVSLDPTKPGGPLLSAQFSLGCGKAGSSPLSGASPPSIVSASLCRDPYCLSYHCAGAGGHDPAALKPGYPLVYPSHALHGVHPSPPTLYPYGFMLPNDPLPHACNWVSANGPCDKRFATSEELLGHLRTHTAFAAADKLVAGYPGSPSTLAAAMACHMHVPTGAAPLRSPHHALGLAGRYHPYPKSPVPVPVPAATGPYYSPYALYGQRLTTAPGLGYQ